VGLTGRQFVLTSALIATAMLLGCGEVRAGYVAIPCIVDQGDSCSPAQSLPPEFEASTGMGGDCATTSQPTSDRKEAQGPLEPPSPSRRLPHAACTFDQGSGAGSSSSSGPGSGPSGSLVSDLPRPHLPQLETSCLLQPQEGSDQPFSVASFLFRPPRAA
jgi:hypothetical protein